MLHKTTQQRAHIRPPVEYNGLHTYPEGNAGHSVAIPNRNISIDGQVYSVPKGISRIPTKWRVIIGGRQFFFPDHRGNPDVLASYADAYKFFIAYALKDPATIPAPVRHEARSKNIEFGIAGIYGNWVYTKPNINHPDGRYVFKLRLQVYVGYESKHLPITLGEGPISQVKLEAALGQMVYMQHICQVNPGMSIADLRVVFGRITDGVISTPLPHHVSNLTMNQIVENLEMRRNTTKGKGHIQPHTNQYVR